MIEDSVFDAVPDSPVHVTHNGEETVANVVASADGITLVTPERAFSIDDDYVGAVTDGAVSFDSEKYDSHFTLRALTVDDKPLFLSGDKAATVDDVKVLATDAIEWGNAELDGDVPGPSALPVTAAAAAPSDESSTDPTIYDFTVSMDGEVLELIKSDKQGVAVRDNGKWVPLDLDNENPTVDDQEWIGVNNDAIKFWDDEGEKNANLKRDDVLKYAVNSE